MANPLFKNNNIQVLDALMYEKPMTVSGTLNKLFILLLIMYVAVMAVYYQFSLKHYDYVGILMLSGIVLSCVLGFLSVLKPKISPILAPIYAFTEGAALSGASCFIELEFPGIVIQAVSITFLTVFVVALLYKLKIIVATEKYRAVICSATFAIMVFYVISFILYMCGIEVSYFTSTSKISIFINILIAAIAALNLIIDFDNIERWSNRIPSYYEWYGALAVCFSIIWLYIEILNLLLKINRR